MRLDHLLSKELLLLELGVRSAFRRQHPVDALAVRSSRPHPVVGFPPGCGSATRRNPLFRFEGAALAGLRAGVAVLLRVGRSDAFSRRSASPLENYRASTSIFVLPSYKEPTVDALASTTDEGRG